MFWFGGPKLLLLPVVMEKYRGKDMNPVLSLTLFVEAGTDGENADPNRRLAKKNAEAPKSIRAIIIRRRFILEVRSRQGNHLLKKNKCVPLILS